MGDMASGRRAFVGRRSELATVDVELRRRGTGWSTVAVGGEPGIGKTRFLAEVQRRAERAGWVVVAGRTAEPATPFSALADALAPVMLVDPPVARGLPRHLADALAMIPGQTCVAVRAFLAQLAGDRPLLVILDDMHRADADTIELIDHVLRHPGGHRAVLAVAYRPRQLPGRLAAVLSRAATDLRLGPLSPTEGTTLLDPPMSAAAADRLHACAEGNPLYLSVLVRAGTDAPDAALPADVRAMLCAEVDVLPAGRRAVLDAAAVLGAVFDPEPLPAVVDRPDPQVWAAMDDLVEADLLRADGGFGRLRFRHPLLWQAVYQSAGAGWRRGAHARAARLLATRGAPAELLAPHVAEAAEMGDETAIRVLVRAAAAQRWRAPVAAARWYGAALRLLPADRRQPARRGRLLLAEAECLATAGQHATSQQAVTEALGLLWHRARPVLRRAVHVAADVCQQRGRHDQAAALLRRARNEPGLDDHGLQIQLATVELLRGDVAAARSLAEGFAHAPGPAPTGFAARGIQAFVQCSTGNAAAAARHADAAAEVLDGLSDVELGQQLSPTLWLLWANVLLIRYGRVLRDVQRIRELCRVGGHDHLDVHLLVVRAESMRRTGRLDEAHGSIEEAHGMAATSGSAELRLLVSAIRCSVATSRGRDSEVAHLADEAEPLADDTSSVFGLIARAAAAAEARLLAGRPDECIDRLLAAGGGDLLPRFDPSSRIRYYELLTRAALSAGRTNDARSWAHLADGAERRGVLPWAAGYSSLAQAHALLALDHPAEAAAMADSAAGAFDRSSNPLDGARARLVGARASAMLGRRVEAVDLAHATGEVAQRCGADRLHDEATRELRRLGRRVPRAGVRGRTRGGILALSERERQVADLAVDGRTNRAIAAALFLSEKTVERHLSAAFAKLGVSSRTALAAQVVTHVRTA